MFHRLILAFAICFSLVLAPIQGAMAQSGQGEIFIAAVVNDDVITSQDLAARLRLTILLSGLENRPEVHQRVAPQILQRLIDETLQKQEAARRGLSATEEEIQSALGKIVQRQNKTVEEMIAFLQANGLPLAVMEDQIYAEILWSKYLVQKLRPRIKLNPQEVKEAVEAATSQTGFTEWHISEITLPVDSPRQADDAERLARGLLQEIQQGASFSKLAQQFPGAPGTTDLQESALRWVNATQLDPAVLEAINKQEEPGIIGPIRTTRGYEIIKLHDTRRMLSANPEDTEVALRQIIFPVEQQDEDAIERYMASAKKLTQTIQGCGDFIGQGQAIEGANAHNLGRLQLRHVHEDMRAIISNLQVGKVSRPILTPVGVHLMIVCQRIEPRSMPVHEEQVREILMRKKLTLEAMKTMRNLRREAFIDVRL